MIFTPYKYYDNLIRLCLIDKILMHKVVEAKSYSLSLIRLQKTLPSKNQYYFIFCSLEAIYNLLAITGNPLVQYQGRSTLLTLNKAWLMTRGRMHYLVVKKLKIVCVSMLNFIYQVNLVHVSSWLWDLNPHMLLFFKYLHTQNSIYDHWQWLVLIFKQK